MGTNIILRLFIVFGLLWCFQTYSWAQEHNLVTTPVVLQEKDSASIGVVAAEKKPIPENALDIIRNEMRRLATRDQAIAEERGWFKSVNYRFTPESMTFFVAIGGVTFNSMWIKSHGDPLAMERHILSLKDPIAHLSFYSFMAANGFYIDFRSRMMDPMTKAQMMRRLSYQGMAIGSLASSITADLGHLGMACVNRWISGGDDPQTHAACNQTLKQWTIRNKFQQYFPQILHMWISQAATEVIDSKARQGFAKVAATDTVKNIFSRPFPVKTAHKLVGVNAKISFSKGTFAIERIRWSGKLIQFAMFVAVDQLILPFDFRPLNNLLKPMLFDFDALAINNFINAGDRINWDEKRISEANNIVCSIREPNCLEEKILDELESFSMQSQQWREHLNSDAEMDLAGWMEMTKKLLSQIDYSYKFYKSYLEELFKFQSVQHNVKSGKVKAEAWENISKYPIRSMPLNGVRMSEEPEYKLSEGIQLVEANFLNPEVVEKGQLRHVQVVTEQLVKALAVKNPLQGDSAKALDGIVNLLKSNEISKIEKALIEINSYLGINSAFAEGYKQRMFESHFYEILVSLRTALGNPLPNVYPLSPFSEAFNLFPANASVATQADFSLWSLEKKYKFRSAADLMTYQTFCGPATGFLDKHTMKTPFVGWFLENDEINLLSPQFTPPRVVEDSAELKAFCSKWRKTFDYKVFDETLYGQKIGEKPLHQYLLDHRRSDIFGDLSNMDGFTKPFEAWWIKTARSSLDAEFKKFDDKYKKLVEITHQNIMGHHSAYNWTMDKIFNQSKYLQKTLHSQLNFEAQFYLQIINRLLNKQYVQPLSDRYKYLEKIAELSKNDQFTSVYNSSVNNEVSKLWNLINSYYSFALQNNVSFEAYIAHSKKIDKSINEILVQAGLKKKGEKSTSAISQVVSNDTTKPASSDSSQGEDSELSAEEKAELAQLMGAKAAEQTLGPAAASGTETTDDFYTDVQVQNPTLRQKVLISAIQGVRAVEGEIRRLIRMKVSLSKTLEMDSQEFLNDFMNNQSSGQKPSGPRKFSPFGQ